MVHVSALCVVHTILVSLVLGLLLISHGSACGRVNLGYEVIDDSVSKMRMHQIAR